METIRTDVDYNEHYILIEQSLLNKYLLLKVYLLLILAISKD